MTRPRIACTLSPDRLAVRKRELGRLRARIVERRVHDTGFHARFEPSRDILIDIARFVDAERECCRFLRFDITAEEDGGPVRLDITGPPGTGSFIEELLPL